MGTWATVIQAVAIVITKAREVSATTLLLLALTATMGIAGFGWAKTQAQVQITRIDRIEGTQGETLSALKDIRSQLTVLSGSVKDLKTSVDRTDDRVWSLLERDRRRPRGSHQPEDEGEDQ